MSKISFETFCIEYYSNHVNMPSDEVYAMFKKEGLLEMLHNDYEDLHGMSMEYMMQFCDEYLGRKMI